MKNLNSQTHQSKRRQQEPSIDDAIFEVEAADTAAPSLEAVQANLSLVAHYILLWVQAVNRSVTLDEILGRAGICKNTWQKYARELVREGWLIRRNYGGMGRGKWRHSRVFLRQPLKDHLSS